MSSNNKNSKKIKFRIQRFNPEKDSKPYFQEYTLDVKPGMTVLEAVLRIMETQDGSIAMRYACRAGICGSDAILINGKYALGCETQVLHLNTDVVTLQPLPGYPIIKDLVVDMSGFFEKIYAVKPYLDVDEEQLSPDKEIYQSPKDREKIDEPVRCILCGACASACPIYLTDKNYLGPAALLKAARFVYDSRDPSKNERLDIVESEDGVFRCHTVFACTGDNSCPKNLNPTDAIQKLKRSIAVRRIKKLLRLA